MRNVKWICQIFRKFSFVFASAFQLSWFLMSTALVSFANTFVIIGRHSIIDGIKSNTLRADRMIEGQRRISDWTIKIVAEGEKGTREFSPFLVALRKKREKNAHRHVVTVNSARLAK